MGDYAEAKKAYASVLATLEAAGAGSELHFCFNDEEVRVNLAAAAAQLGADSAAPSAVPDVAELNRLLGLDGADAVAESWELEYNRAAAAVSMGDVLSAEVRLKAALARATAELEAEQATQAEIDDELAVVRLQLAYCWQQQGRRGEAANAYAGLLGAQLSDSVAVAVAANNEASLRSHEGASLAAVRALKPMASVEAKMSAPMRFTMGINRAAVQAHAGRAEQAREALHVLQGAQPDVYDASEMPARIEAALTSDAAAKTALLRSHASTSRAAALMLIQQRADSGDVDGAVAEVLALPGLDTRVGTAAACAQLYLAAGRADDAVAFLQRQVDSRSSDIAYCASLRQHMADLAAREGRWLHAAKAYQVRVPPRLFLPRLFSVLTPSQALLDGGAAALPDAQARARVQARLVLAMAHVDPHRAAALAADLPAPPRSTLAAEFNVHELEALPPPRVRAAKLEDAAGPRGSQLRVVRRRRKPKTMRRPPKDGFDPSVQPDPERWLPMKERSYYRKSRSARKAGASNAQGGGTQKLAKKLDAAQKAPSQTPAPKKKKPVKGKKKKGGKKRK